MSTTTTVTITEISNFPFTNGMNANGAIVGGNLLDGGNGAHEVPLLYSAGQVTTLPTGTLGWGMTSSINDQGVIAGYLITDPNAVPSSTNASVMTLMTEAVVWQNGSYTVLTGYPGDATSGAGGINRSGTIVGSSGPDGANTIHALEWQSTSATPTVLPPLTGDKGAAAGGINDVGTVIGVSEGTYDFAVMWQNGQVSKLATLATETSSLTVDINNSGQIIGEAWLNHKQEQAVLWQNGTVTALTAPGAIETEANGINDLGQIVGDASSPDGTMYAVLWQNGQAIDLNTLLPANSGWVLAKADAIDDKGDIVGMGYYQGTQYGFILTLGGSVSVQASSAQSAVASFATGDLAAKLVLTDSAANVSATLDGLQSLALANDLGSITLTDSGVPSISLSAHQLTTDAATLAAITSNFTLSVTADSTSESITGLAGHATSVTLSGNAAQYSVAETANGITVSGNGATYQLSGITALQFADQTEILAAAPGTGAVTTGNITELYAAVLGREPDIGGLAFYQNYLKSNPATPLAQFAQWFLQSSEYTSSHVYAPDSTGDAKFITDSYQNLLHRAPDTGAVAFYQGVIDSFTKGLVQGSVAYTAAEALGHAWVLTYFSASPEFLGDVQITGSHPADAQHWLVLT